MKILLNKTYKEITEEEAADFSISTQSTDETEHTDKLETLIEGLATVKSLAEVRNVAQNARDNDVK